MSLIPKGEIRDFESFKKFKAQWRTKVVIPSRPYDWTMEENSHQRSFEACSIQRPLTTPYSSQQNGVVERKNRVILNKVKSMLHNKMSKEFSGEVIVYAVYILKRSPTMSFEDITPQETWSGKKSNISHLKIFGCIAYATGLYQRKRKLDDKVSNIFSLTIVLELKPTSYLTQKNRKCMWVEMWNFIKIEYGIGV